METHALRDLLPREHGELSPSAEVPPNSPRDRAVGVRVGLSYAGKSDGEPYLEAIPRALADSLRRSDCIVLEYRGDKQESDLRVFVAKVASLAHQDYVVCFLSRKYLYSPFCMVELVNAADALLNHRLFEVLPGRLPVVKSRRRPVGWRRISSQPCADADLEEGSRQEEAPVLARSEAVGEGDPSAGYCKMVRTILQYPA